MKTLHRYVLRQVVVTLMMTVVVFTFVLMLGNVLKEIIGLLVSRQINFSTVLQAFGLLVPFVLIFALPMGLLTAVLLVFGRLSADQELTAVRSSGISLLALITPVLLLSVVLSGVAAFINLQLAPQCRVAYRDLIFQLARAKAVDFIPEKTYIKDLNPNWIVYVAKVRGTNLEDVLIYEMRDNKIENYTRAEHGEVSFDLSNSVVSVVLMHSSRVFFREGYRLPQPMLTDRVEFSFTNTAPRTEHRKADVSDMTFCQLQAELSELERLLPAAPPLESLSPPQMRTRMQQLRAQGDIDLTLPIRVQMHRQVAFSFAGIAFTLVGIPLALRAHRRETTFGFALALLLVAIYNGFFALGLVYQARLGISPYLIFWLPNFLFQGIGAILLWRSDHRIQ